jgi:hypothetical protein
LKERERELEELKRKFENRDDEKSHKPDNALDFNRNAYLQMGFIESAKWIKNVLAKTMLQEMEKEEFRHSFESFSEVQ